MLRAMTPRHTRQRAAIAAAIARAPGPLGVQQLLAEAQRELPALGVATVYRTVRLLQEQGEVREVLIDGEARYESAHLGHHHHFACRRCGRVFDLEHCPLHLRHDDPALRGFRVEAHELTLYGLCPACASAPSGPT